MRVCYVASTSRFTRDAGALGSTTHTAGIAKGLRKLGAEVVVVCDRGRGEGECEEVDGITVYRLKRGVAVSTRKAKRLLPMGLSKWLGPLSRRWLARKTSEIAVREKCDAILERAQAGIGWKVSALTGKPLYVEVIDALFDERSLDAAEKVFGYAADILPVRARKKFVKVLAGVDGKVFRPLGEESAYDVGYAGSFKEWDGLEDLVEAVKRLKKEGTALKVLLAGNGPRRKAVEEKVKAAGLTDGFAFVGVLPKKELVDALNRCRLCVAPYNVRGVAKGGLDKHGFYYSPLKVLEYMACGKAVVAPDYALVKELLPPGNFVYRAGDRDDLAAKMGAALAAGGKAREEIREANRAAAEKFSWEGVAETMLKEMSRLREMETEPERARVRGESP